jgi:hypothetical protein
MVLQTPLYIGLHRRLDICLVRDNWHNAKLLHALIGAVAHAPAQQHLAIGDRLGHTGMAVTMPIAAKTPVNMLARKVTA